MQNDKLKQEWLAELNRKKLLLNIQLFQIVLYEKEHPMKTNAADIMSNYIQRQIKNVDNKIAKIEQSEVRSLFGVRFIIRKKGECVMADRITKEEILENWGDYYLTYLVQILNKEYDLEEAIEDIKSFRKKESA